MILDRNTALGLGRFSGPMPDIDMRDASPSMAGIADTSDIRVANVQQILKGAGLPIRVDGRLGPCTCYAVNTAGGTPGISKSIIGTAGQGFYDQMRSECASMSGQCSNMTLVAQADAMVAPQAGTAGVPATTRKALPPFVKNLIKITLAAGGITALIYALSRKSEAGAMAEAYDETISPKDSVIDAEFEVIEGEEVEYDYAKEAS